MVEPLVIAKTAGLDIALLPQQSNRHGLIAGATGTGKTVTLQKMAEAFASIGVPVFLADIKGDLAGLGASGELTPKLSARLEAMGIMDFSPSANTVEFWDVFGELGHPVRATISDMGPILLSRLLGLNETQAGVMQLVFKIADDNGLLLLDLKDLRAMVQHVGENARTFTTSYGNISAASVGAIQRNLLMLDEQGGSRFFGEPMLDVNDLLQTDNEGKGVINILAAEKLYQSPKLYGTFLLWMLSELFERLPEVGDQDKPKIVFFFDEAHLLFKEASKVLLEKIEQVVRLIRSKGVGVFFVTQSPLDLPQSVLGQLGNRVQHALRAYTPQDQKTIKAVAQTMRVNPAFNALEAVTELGVGEALISFLDEKGTPSVVQRGFIIAPHSRMGVLTTEERQKIRNLSSLQGHYEQEIDRESAYELLRRSADEHLHASQDKPSPVQDILFGSTGPRGGQRDGLVQIAAKSVTRTFGNTLGRQLVRGLLGSLFGGNKKR